MNAKKMTKIEMMNTLFPKAVEFSRTYQRMMRKNTWNKINDVYTKWMNCKITVQDAYSELFV